MRSVPRSSVAIAARDGSARNHAAPKQEVKSIAMEVRKFQASRVLYISDRVQAAEACLILITLKVIVSKSDAYRVSIVCVNGRNATPELIPFLCGHEWRLV